MLDTELLRKYFYDDRFCRFNGIIIDEVNEDYCTVSVNAEDRHLNANNGVQGGLIFTLADFAFAVHANRNGIAVVSQSAGISYLRVAKGTKIMAKAVPLHTGRKTVVYNVEVTDDTGAFIAAVTVNGTVLGANPAFEK